MYPESKVLHLSSGVDSSEQEIIDRLNSDGLLTATTSSVAKLVREK